MQEAHSKEKKEIPMKKTASILIFALLLGLIASPAYAAKDIGIEIDGVAIKTDVKPETKNDRTMVPLRVVAESLATNVEWADPEVKLTKHNLNVVLKANSKSAVDVTTDKWYSYEPKDEDSLQQLFDMAEAQGFLVIISNNVA